MFIKTHLGISVLTQKLFITENEDVTKSAYVTIERKEYRKEPSVAVSPTSYGYCCCSVLLLLLLLLSLHLSLLLYLGVNVLEFSQFHFLFEGSNRVWQQQTSETFQDRILTRLFIVLFNISSYCQWQKYVKFHSRCFNAKLTTHYSMWQLPETFILY